MEQCWKQYHKAGASYFNWYGHFIAVTIRSVLCKIVIFTRSLLLGLGTRLTPRASRHFEVERKCELVERLDLVHIHHGHWAEIATFHYSPSKTGTALECLHLSRMVHLNPWFEASPWWWIFACVSLSHFSGFNAEIVHHKLAIATRLFSNLKIIHLRTCTCTCTIHSMHMANILPY